MDHVLRPGELVLVKTVRVQDDNELKSTSKKEIPYFTPDRNALPFIIHTMGTGYAVLYNQSSGKYFKDTLNNLRFYPNGHVYPPPIYITNQPPPELSYSQLKGSQPPPFLNPDLNFPSDSYKNLLPHEKPYNLLPYNGNESEPDTTLRRSVRKPKPTTAAKQAAEQQFQRK